MTPVQARAFLSVLQLGRAGASNIAEHSKIKRVTCYAALQELIDLGLVESDNSEAVRTFSAKPLDNFEGFFMGRAQLAITSYRKIQSLIPDLKLLTNNIIDHPQIDYLDGREVITTYISGIPEEVDICSIFVSHHGHYELFNELLKRAAVKNYRPRAIVPNSIKMNLLTYLDHRVVPARIAHFPSTSIVLKDRVIIVFESKEFMQAVVMCDLKMCDHYQMLFDMTWRMLSGEHLVSAKYDEGIEPK